MVRPAVSDLASGDNLSPSPVSPGSATPTAGKGRPIYPPVLMHSISQGILHDVLQNEGKKQQNKKLAKFALYASSMNLREMNTSARRLSSAAPLPEQGSSPNSDRRGDLLRATALVPESSVSARRPCSGTRANSLNGGAQSDQVSVCSSAVSSDPSGSVCGSESQQVADMSGAALKTHFEGWLMKEDPTTKTWRRRYFILDGCRLWYYELGLKGSIYLAEGAGVHSLDKDEPTLSTQVSTFGGFASMSGFDKRFNLSTSERIYYLAADNEEEMKFWVESLKRAVVMAEGERNQGHRGGPLKLER